MVLCWWGVLKDILVSSTGLITWIGHRKEIWKLMFRIHSNEGLTLETSAPEFSIQWPIHIINPVDKTKLSCVHKRHIVLMIGKLDSSSGEQGWWSGESTHFPPVCTRFDSGLCHMWFKFDVNPCLALRIFLQVLLFPQYKKTNSNILARIEDPHEDQLRLMWHPP